jgi:WhiB family redox-sensing transcriptional regulator
MDDSLDVCAHCGDPRFCDWTCDADWKKHAECAGMDESIFFPHKPGDSRQWDRALDYRPGKLVCTRCPVMGQCRAFADRNREEWGIWGGLTAKELTTLRYVPKAKMRPCGWCTALFVTSSSNRKHCCEGCKKAQKQALKGGPGALFFSTR